MQFQEARRHRASPGHRRKLFSERGLWELVVERRSTGLMLDLWWSAWPYARVVGYCVSSEPGGEERVLAALLHALDSVPENAPGWAVELYLPPADEARPPLDPRSFAALPRFPGGNSAPTLDG